MSEEAHVEAVARAARHHLSASRRYIAQHCLWWARPEVVLDPRSSSDAASLGSALHRAAELGQDGEEVDLAAVALQYGLSKQQTEELRDLFDQWFCWWTLQHAGRSWCSEVALAYDPLTDAARALPSQGARDYSRATPDEICGTLDLLVVDLDGAENVDLKTGRGSHSVQDHLLQLEHGAVAMARIHGLDEVTVKTAHVTPAGVLVTRRTLDVFALDAAALTMRDELRRIPTAQPNPGDHCGWCPAKGSCPETLRLVQQVLGDVSVDVPITDPVDSQPVARALLDGLPRVEAWVKARRKLLEDFAKREPVDLLDGRRWGSVEKRGYEDFDLSVVGAVEFLRDVLGVAADVAIEVDTNKSAIQRALRRLLASRPESKRGDAGTMERLILQRLRELGALVRGKPYQKFEIIKASKSEEQEEDE